MPGGKLKCCSLIELRKLKNQKVELEEPQSFEAYRAVAELMGLSFLGMLNDDVVSDFKLKPGTLLAGGAGDAE